MTDHKKQLAKAHDWISDTIRDVAELPDRNSPDDYPGMMLVTSEELRLILERSQQSEIDRLTRELAEAKLSMRQFAGAVIASSQPESGGEPVASDADVDAIVTSLYRRFKDWSRRGFGPDDVTWCEVKADVVAIIAAQPLYTRPQPAVVVLPDGWKLVPVQPTHDQQYEAAFALCAQFGVEFTQANEAFAMAVYDQLVKFAPANPAATPITAQELAGLRTLYAAAAKIGNWQLLSEMVDERAQIASNAELQVLALIHLPALSAAIDALSAQEVES